MNASATRKALWRRLKAKLRATRDPRIISVADIFDTYPYYGGTPKRRRR